MVSLQELMDAVDQVDAATRMVVSSVSPGQSFCVLGAGSAAVWDHLTSQWTATTISNPTKVLESNGNFCVISSNEARAWTPGSGWISLPGAVAGIVDVVGSKGNFCLWTTGALIAAFDGSSGNAEWNVLTGDRYDQTVASNGNFCAIGSHRAVAWNKVTGEWTRVMITGAREIAGADRD
jgi:hypothetical protein